MNVEGVGRVVEWGEWWRLLYDGCGHEIWFDRVTHRLFEPAKVEEVVRKYYSECTLCRPWTHPA